MIVLNHLRFVLISCLAISLWPTQAKASHFNVTFYDQDRYYWDLFSYYWYWNNGTIDAFDGWGRATINGSAFADELPVLLPRVQQPGCSSSNNPTYNGFRVQARVYVPSSGMLDSRNYGRTIWNLTNTSGSPHTELPHLRQPRFR